MSTSWRSRARILEWLGRFRRRNEETPEDSRLLAAAARVRPSAQRFGSPTCSDWVFLRHTDAIKCGPGTSRRSHTPNECVDLPELSAARAFYADLAREYLGAT